MTMDGRTPGRVEAIWLAGPKTEARRRVDAVLAVAGRGLEGDRYFGARGRSHRNAPDRQVTLIEGEAIDAVAATGRAFTGADARRNLVTRGVRLNELVTSSSARSSAWARRCCAGWSAAIRASTWAG